MTRYLFAIAMLFLLSCSGKRTTNDLQKVLNQRIIIPTTGQWIFDGKDTIVNPNGSYKILVYYNSQGCSSCKMKDLPNWKPYFKEIDSLNGVNKAKIDVIFIFKTNKEDKSLRLGLSSSRFPYPVLCDESGLFEKNNLLPENDAFHVFLLDNNNAVIAVGSPLYNTKMWNHYKSKILSK